MNRELKHYGIRGQKWGVRRFQNPDGSYTAAGRKRYGINYKPVSLIKDSNKKAYGNVLSTMVSDNLIDKALGDQKRSQSDKDYYDRTKDSGHKDLVKNVARTAAATNLSPISIAITLAKAAAGQAIASVKTKKVEKANATGEVDPKTGFHMKDREYTRKEDIRSVNPGFKNFNDNTKNNCMLCTMTYDLRKRGYAVSANTTTSGYLENDLGRWYPDVKVNKVSNTNEKGKKSRIALVKNAISDMESLGSGARGNLMVRFSQSRLVDIPAGGHSMVFEVNEKGKLQILDCQTNKIYSNPSLILSRCYDINYARLDNVNIDTTHIKEVAH